MKRALIEIFKYLDNYSWYCCIQVSRKWFNIGTSSEIIKKISGFDNYFRIYNRK